MKKKKIIFWAPFLSNVGTKLAVINSALSLSKYSKNKIYIFNVLGEFNGLKIKNVKIINIFNVEKFLPKTKLFSKFFLYFLSFVSIPILIYKINSYKFNHIVSNLVSIVPLICSPFFKKTKIILSIQGYPRFNWIRSLLWQLFYSKANLIITMSDLTKKIISNKIKKKVKIVKINNPIITNTIRKYSQVKIDKKYKKFFNKKVVICVGRLTRQKNFFALIQSLSKNKIFNKQYNLLLLGEGEDRAKIEKYILNNNLKNIILLGYKKNPFNLIRESQVLISPSLWEDPGHSLIEATFLKVPIITSNCPSAPNELFKNKINCLKFDLKNFNQDLNKKFNLFNKLTDVKKRKLTQNAYKISKNFTLKKFYSDINLFIK